MYMNKNELKPEHLMIVIALVGFLMVVFYIFASNMIKLF